MSRRFLLGAALGAAAGIAIAVVDSRPGWDDTGITAAALVLAAIASSLVMGARDARSALIATMLATVLVGGWIPLVELPAGGGVGSLLSLGFAALGAAIALAARPPREGQDQGGQPA